MKAKATVGGDRVWHGAKRTPAQQDHVARRNQETLALALAKKQARQAAQQARQATQADWWTLPMDWQEFSARAKREAPRMAAVQTSPKKGM